MALMNKKGTGEIVAFIPSILDNLNDDPRRRRRKGYIECAKCYNFVKLPSRVCNQCKLDLIEAGMARRIIRRKPLYKRVLLKGAKLSNK